MKRNAGYFVDGYRFSVLFFSKFYVEMLHNIYIGPHVFSVYAVDMRSFTFCTCIEVLTSSTDISFDLELVSRNWQK